MVEPAVPGPYGAYRTDPARPSGVTRREAQVLSLVTEHYGNAEIAHLLNVSKRTVESHMAALLRKFAVADRAALIRAATAPRSAAAGPDIHVGSPLERPLEPHARYPSRLRSAELSDRNQRREQLQQRRIASLMARLRNSTRRHEALADHLDQAAARWRIRAIHTPDDTARAVALRHAATANKEADSARSRATTSRRLLDQVSARQAGSPSAGGAPDRRGFGQGPRRRRGGSVRARCRFRPRRAGRWGSA
jgi:DNA-binding CsgD family transcriptional regulator